MKKSYQICCPKCNNKLHLYRYGRDKNGYQKYQCQNCYHQWAPDSPKKIRYHKYPDCPVCGKSTFLHHCHEYHSTLRCSDKKCGHSFIALKPTVIQPSTASKLFGKVDFKRMRYPIHVILMALTMFYIGKNSFRNISMIMNISMNIQVSHTNIRNWCTKFAPMFHNMAIELVPMLDFNSDEWHMDETIVKINGQKHYLWLIMDSETRFVLGFHLSPHRSSSEAFSLLNSVKNLGTPKALVSDRYKAYNVPAETVVNVRHIRVESFQDDITNNLIESFNGQFKAWYKTKRGFASFDSANNLISMFFFFYNFVRPHSSLNNLTPAQCAGLKLTKKQRRKFLIVV